jgi:hypothetical protein
MTNPYGDGTAGTRIAKVLRQIDLNPSLLKKTFRDTDVTTATKDHACG